VTEPERPDLQAELERLRSRQPAATPDPEPTWEHMPEIADALRLRRQGQWHEAIPSRFVAAATVDMDERTFARPDGKERLAEWTVTPRGRNLMLWGTVGTGKTHAAVAACREAFFERGQDVAFWPVVELLDQLRPGGPEAAMRDAMDVDLLILDDLGGERPTDWTAERLYAIVNRRWLEERPVIGTTNLPLTNKVASEGYTGQTLEEALGGRTFSRLVGSGAVVLRLAGPDRRR
jgi:hypothetical protein